MSGHSPARSEESGPLCIGLDVGTSGVKLAVVSTSRSDGVLFSCEKEIRYCVSKEGFRVQNAADILDVVKHLLESVPAHLQCRVRRLGVAGQMHGCVQWSKHGVCSDLVTWEDQRCSKRFLDSVFDKTGHRLHSGYGGATLSWFAAEKQDAFVNIVGCGTIMDFVVESLVRLPESTKSFGVACMDVTNAASWGLFDPQKRSWDPDALQKLGIPTSIMPQIVDIGSDVRRVRGQTSLQSLFNLQEGETVVDVYVAVCAICMRVRCAVAIPTSADQCLCRLVTTQRPCFRLPRQVKLKD